MPKSISIPSDNRIHRVPALKLPVGGGLKEGLVKAEIFQPPTIHASDTIGEPFSIINISSLMEFKEAEIVKFDRASVDKVEVLSTGLQLEQLGWSSTNFEGSLKNSLATLPSTNNGTSTPYFRGYQFSVDDAPIQVIRFRYRNYTAGRTTVIYLWDVETETILASISHYAAAQGIYSTDNLPTPVILQPDKEYILMFDVSHAARYYYQTSMPGAGPNITLLNGLRADDASTFPTTTTTWWVPIELVYYNERVATRHPSGTFELESPVYSTNPVSSSLFQLNTTLPDQTTVALSLDASLDGGVNWEGPVACVHGGAVPHINGRTLDNVVLKLIGTLTTGNPEATPILNSVTLRANY